MIEYNHLLTNIIVFFELFIALLVAFGLYCASKHVQELEQEIKEYTGEMVECIAELRLEVKKLKKHLDLIRKFEKYGKLTKLLKRFIGFLDWVIILMPSGGLKKLYRFIVIKVFKHTLSGLS